MNHVELMAPAGSFEALQAALDNGADSVYFGIEQLNMRAVSSINFTEEDLGEIVRRCRERGVRTYITLNTILYDHDMALMRRIVDRAAADGVSAIIAADHAAIATVKFYSLFADTMVLSRELTVSQVKTIVDSIRREHILGPSGELVQVEIFAHGALCMAVSGKCYLSLHTHNSSANRGACRQNWLRRSA